MELKRSGSAFILGGGADFYETICGQLIDLGMQETKLFAGENLTLEDEQIFTSTPEEIKSRKAPSLAVLYAEWTGPEDLYPTVFPMRHSPAETFR